MPTAALTSFRQFVTAAVVTAVSPLVPDIGANPLAINPGKFDGPVQGISKGCAYSIGAGERSQNVSEQTMEVRVRVFLNIQAFDPDPETGHDPTILENIAETVQEALGGGDQRAGGAIWYFRCAEYEINLDQFGVEWQFLGFDRNHFASTDPVVAP